MPRQPPINHDPKDHTPTYVQNPKGRGITLVPTTHPAQVPPKLRRIKFTNLPLLPSAPGLQLGIDTPYTFQLRCKDTIPPICAECGSVYFSNTKPAHFYWCSAGCQDRYNTRLSQIWVPIAYRSKQWEGRDTVPPLRPPELAYLNAWNNDTARADRKQNRHASRICGATLSTHPTNMFPLKPDLRGEPCLLAAGWGTPHVGMGRCKNHGGLNPSHTRSLFKKKAERDMLERKAVFGESIEVSPEDAIMQELWRTNGSVEWYRQRIEQITEMSRDPEANQDEAIMQYTKLGMTPSVWVSLYNEERDRLAAVAKVAAGMGVAERSIRIVEEQGRMLATVIQTLMVHPLLALTPMQQINAKDAVREILATVTLAATPTHANMRSARVVLEDGLTQETHDYLEALEADSVETPEPEEPPEEI